MENVLSSLQKGSHEWLENWGESWDAPRGRAIGREFLGEVGRELSSAVGWMPQGGHRPGGRFSWAQPLGTAEGTRRLGGFPHHLCFCGSLGGGVNPAVRLPSRGRQLISIEQIAYSQRMLLADRPSPALQRGSLTA